MASTFGCWDKNVFAFSNFLTDAILRETLKFESSGNVQKRVKNKEL